MNTSNNNRDIIKAKDKFSNFKGKDFRKGQSEAIQHIIESDREITVVCAPTGSGKSLIGMTAGMMHDRFSYLCSTKHLQGQITHDFPEAKFMFGRVNFGCNQDPKNRTANLCIHTKATPCDLKSECYYETYKNIVLNHPLQILNYHYLLNEANYVGSFSNYPIIIADEADVIEGLLTGFVELRISRSILNSLDLSPPQYRTSTAKNGLASWRQWAKEEAITKVMKRMGELEIQISNLKPREDFFLDDNQTVNELKALQNLLSKLTMFCDHMDETWIFQENENRRTGNIDAWIFQPIWLTRELSLKYFFRHAYKFVLMSATFPPKPILAEMLGCGTEDIDYIELPSTFPIANRPVLLDPVADMSFKTFEDDLPRLLKKIEEILEKHPNERGLIHTVSWRLNAAIMKLGHPRMISHTSYDKNAALDRFMASENGVFVSPSSTRGIDLPDDLCRFTIVTKAPFQGLGDKLVKSRVYSSGLGKYWYRAICAQDLVQASGRGVRHKDDWCTTYILDKQAEKLVVDNQNLFPRYWMDAVDYV